MPFSSIREDGFIKMKIVNALDYGAIGDGIADDTAALQAAIDESKSYYMPLMVFLPAGKYKLTSPLVIDRRIEIVGSGYGTQIFQSGDEHLFSIVPYIPAAAHDMRMRNMMLGSAATTTGKAVISIDSVSGGVFEDLYIAGGYDGIRLDNSHCNRFARLTTYSQPNGFFGTCSGNQYWVHAVDQDSNANIFISPNINMGNWGFYWEAGNVLTILGGNIQGGSGVLGAYFSGTDRLHIAGLHFESISVELTLENCSNSCLQEIGCGVNGLILKACTGIKLISNKVNALWIDGRCKRIEIDGIRCPNISIDSSTVTLKNVEDPANTYHAPGGIQQRSPINLIDGDMEIWSAGLPYGFSKFDSSQTTAQDTTVVRQGAYSAKEVIGSGRTRAGLYKTGFDYDKYAKGDAVNYRSSAYQWTVSANGTDEYYCEASGSGDPGIKTEPLGVLLDDTFASEGTLGSLAAGEWCWGDNDSLNYDTIYVRLNGAGPAPDGEVVGYVKAVHTLRQITLSAWVYKESGSANPYLGMEYDGGNRDYASAPVPTAGWTRIKRSFNVQPGYTYCKPMFCNCWYGQGSPGDTVYWDCLEITEGDCASPMYDDSKGMDGDFRVAGRFVTSTIGIFSDGDATPDISTGNIFKTANTSSTIITMFDSGTVGQEIKVIFGDSNTTMDFTGTNLKGNGGGDWNPAQGDHVACVFDGTDWYCNISDNT